MTEVRVPHLLSARAPMEELTLALVNVPSESHHEGALADIVEQALAQFDHLELHRRGNTVVARRRVPNSTRVVVAGHLDTVPAHDNLPGRLEPDAVVGLGSCDMKGGVAVGLACAAHVTDPVFDVTYVFYEGEEVATEFNGLKHLLDDPIPGLDLAEVDFAVLMEPSNAGIEAGCQGTLRVEVSTTGVRSHSARAWRGVNAIHAAAPVLARLNEYSPRVVSVDGLEYREGLNAVGITGGVATNVIPDSCTVTVNYRYAPGQSAEAAEQHVRDVFEGFDVVVTDHGLAAEPGLHLAAAADFVARVRAITGREPAPKFGWTDVARFAQIGVPAVNFGPGDPSLAHTREESVPIADLHVCHEVMADWLSGR